MPVDGLIESAPHVARRLLAHYDVAARGLPWRVPPGGALPEPYRVWLSEVMLQQTGVAAVIPYYERFLARWPTVEALAAADDADLMAAWAGLGYYARARNLLACARAVARDHGGRFPATEAGLRALPGIGAYTAAAVAAIAFGERAVVVDGNVERVVARLAAIGTPLPAARAQIRVVADMLTPRERPGDFAQAMMDLGATLCTPRAPDCPRCPLSGDCRAFALGDPARFPVKAPKRAKPLRQGIAWWVEAQGAVWLVRRPEKGLLGGMRALPSTGWTTEPPPQVPPLPGAWVRRPAPVRHVFTHFALDLHVSALALPAPPPAAAMARAFGPGLWWPLAALGEAGLPTVFARAAALALQPPLARVAA